MSQPIKARIKETALELGFCDFGVAAAETPDEEYKCYRKWIENGCHASMSYLERNLAKRLNVRNILPGARSVIVTAFNYNTPFEHQDNMDSSEDYGKISRYAWGVDYHKILLPKLEELALVIAEYFPGAETKVYTDTGPILEKAWAVRAGIGWLGKNGILVSRKFGSWIFLGILITTAKIETDKEMKDYCGKCTKCIDACPTHAIVEPKVVDSRKCLSYWTIEAKHDMQIPPEIAAEARGWIFGCDVCQNVCPWNKKIKVLSIDKRFYPRNNETALNLEDILIMNQEEFSLRFKDSPVRRAKLAGLQRNARSLRSSKAI